MKTKAEIVAFVNEHVTGVSWREVEKHIARRRLETKIALLQNELAAVLNEIDLLSAPAELRDEFAKAAMELAFGDNGEVDKEMLACNTFLELHSSFYRRDVPEYEKQATKIRRQLRRAEKDLLKLLQAEMEAEDND